MLELNRNAGQSVIVELEGKTIEVVVLKSGPQVRLGFKASRTININRKEIHILKSEQ